MVAIGPNAAPMGGQSRPGPVIMRGMGEVDMADIQEGLELLRQHREGRAPRGGRVEPATVERASRTPTPISHVPATQVGRAVRAPSDKLMPYDGVSEPYEAFELRFEGSSRHYQWDAADRLYFLRQALDKRVSSVVGSSKNITTAEQLMEVLRARYGKEAQADNYRYELKWHVKKGTETQYDLCDEIQRMTSLAFPDMQDSKV